MMLSCRAITRSLHSLSAVSQGSKFYSSQQLHHFIEQHLEGNGVLARASGQKTERLKKLLGQYNALAIKSELDVEPWNTGQRVFCNSEVEMRDLDVIGFDYDYTLAHYTPALEELTYTLARDMLVKEYKYPTELRLVDYDPEFAIRGLWFDTTTALLMKFTFSNKMSDNYVYRGRRQLSKDEILSIYDAPFIPDSYLKHNMRTMVDIFSLPEVCLLADVVEYFDQNNIPFDPTAVHEDISTAIRSVHKSGLLHYNIMRDLPQYLATDDKVLETLEHLRSLGKKLFLLTNSPFDFVDAGLHFLTRKYNWTELFDCVIVRARKPEWFTGVRPFREFDTVSNNNTFTPVSNLDSNKVYIGGNVKDFLKYTGTSNRTLYVGDHIFADLQAPARSFGWRTGAIIRELENEIDIEREPHNYLNTVQRSLCEEILRELHTFPVEKFSEKEKELEWLVLEERKSINAQLGKRFHKYWGSVFQCDGIPTPFAFHLLRFVDLYTSKIDNFLPFSAHHRFLPHRRQQLPHRSVLPIF